MRLGRFRAWFRQRTAWIPRPVRRVIVSVIGGTLLLLALIGFVMPIMPGFIFLPFGLAILAVEFTWAARWLKRLKCTAQGISDRMRGTAAAKSQEQKTPSAGDEHASSSPAPLRAPPAPAVKPSIVAPIVRPRPNAAA